MGAAKMGREEKHYIEQLNRKLDTIIETQAKMLSDIARMSEKFIGYEDKLTYTKNKLDRYCDEDNKEKKEIVSKFERLERDLLDKCNKYDRDFYERTNKLEKENLEQHEKIRAELIRITAYAAGAMAVGLIVLQYLNVI